MRRRVGELVALAACLARRPALWSTALRQAVRLVPTGWWRRRPFLPVPSGEYLEFRTVTQYGSGDHQLVPDDVMNYLAWCKLVRR